jgi:hypothetical protein
MAMAQLKRASFVSAFSFSGNQNLLQQAFPSKFSSSLSSSKENSVGYPNLLL